MQSNRKTIKKKFPKEKLGNKSSKKTDKPWVMQYKWRSEEHFKRHSWFSSYNPDWQNGYDKYMSTEHALQMLSKDLRSPFTRLQQGRLLRLFNKVTGEILPLEVQGTEVKIV